MADAQLFGKYLLMRKLAAGGMGEVFLAKQQGPEGFEKFLVIKRILSHHTDNPDYVDMFFAEARLAAKMSHSNIVQIFEMGEIDGSYFIAMEYVNGKSMKDIIDAARARGVKLEPAHIAEMVTKLASGLGYAHNLTDMSGNTLNIIHRDVNPHNALVTYSGETKVIDFGIAKSDTNEHKTETGTIKGKFVYMSPEQSAAEKIDKRSDIFAIGIVLYEMLAGENPFQKPNIVLSLDAIQRFNPPPPSSLNPDFAPFDAIVAKALAKKADDRYQDCADLVTDLQRALLTGEIPRPTKNLSQVMKELFNDQIEKEQRFMQDFAKGNTNATIAPSRAKPGSGAFARQDTSSTDVAPPVQTPAPHHTNITTGGGSQTGSRTSSAMVRRRKNRVRFYALMGAITVAMVSAVVIILTAGQATNQDPESHMNKIQVGDQQPSLNPPPPQPVVAQAPVTPPPVVETKPIEQHAAATKADEKKDNNKKEREQAKKDREREKKAGKEQHEEEKKDDKKVVVLGESPSEGKDSQKREPTKERSAQDDGSKQPAPADGGTFMIYSTPNASIFRDGTRLSAGGGPTKVEITRNSGVIKIGDSSSPFQISLSFKVVGGKSVELSVDSNPWAIVKRDGIALGKTPRPGISAGSQTQRFEFVSPGVQGGMTVVVRFTPG